MNRKMSSSGESRSLDLLLDTLCNVFGGIVLIACLLAILPRQKMPPPLLPGDVAEAQMVERRIIAARWQIKELNSEIEKLSSSVDPETAALEARLNELQKLNHELESKLSVMEKQELSNAEMHSLAAEGNVDELKARLDELNRIKAKEIGVKNAVVEKAEFLNSRVAKLSQEIKQAKQYRAKRVRFPRERNAKSSPFPVILRYNRIYPIFIGKDFRDNPAVSMHRSEQEDTLKVTPIRGKGIDQPALHQDLQSALRKVSAMKDMYISVYIYPDSHDIFQELVKEIGDHKLGYGIEFVPVGRVMYFGSSGTKPPEL